MRFLYDQNLSYRLVAELQDLYPNYLHVRDIGMKESDDSDIWDYAAQNGYTIQETLHLLSIPGMRESIIEGLKTPVEECAEELDW